MVDIRPGVIAETARLVLRREQPGDLAVWLEHINTPEVMGRIGGVQTPEKVAESFAKMAASNAEDELPFVFVALKTDGEVRVRARRLITRGSLVVVVVAAAFLLITQAEYGKAATWVTALVAALALIGGIVAAIRGREGWAFLGTAIALAAAVATLFGDLWPNVMPSSTNSAFSLTVHNASSTHYTLTVMTWVAVVFTPIVLLYQGWTYWVFRKRLTRTEIPPQGGTTAKPDRTAV